MKVQTFVATAVLGALASLTPAHAQTIDPCTVYLCMAAMAGSGTSGGAGCPAAITFWHAVAPAGLAIYDPYDGFESTASANLRKTYMSSCKGSKTLTNGTIMQAIITEYGYLP